MDIWSTIFNIFTSDPTQFEIAHNYICRIKLSDKLAKQHYSLSAVDPRKLDLGLRFGPRELHLGPRYLATTAGSVSPAVQVRGN